MNWSLFVDDIRTPLRSNSPTGFPWIIARSSDEAIELVQELGMPEFMSLDHDLGGEDTVFDFLKWLVYDFADGDMNAPDYEVHSANSVGVHNIVSFMESWKKSKSL